jgi:glycerol-3-phosphate acyltransferase PlsY
VHVATALAAILGHNYTFWLGFKGGKGIATTAGAILPIMPWALLVAVVTWVIALLTSRYVSVASIAAAVVIPLTLVAQSLLTAAWNPVVLGFALFASTLAIWKHRSNIARLRRGEENRFGKKPATATAPESSPDRP